VAKMTMVQAINLALTQEMAKDERVVVLGEDVGVNEGVFRVTAGLHKAYGDARVVDTPLAESAILGTAVGMALAGLRPVAEMQFDGFSYLMWGQLEGHASRFRARTQGRWTCPLVVRFPYGGGVRALEHHSESREAMYAQIPGLKVVVPSGPRNARALLVAAIRDPDAVVFMEPKRSYRAFREEVPEEEEVLELGKANVEREGSDVTLVSWGATMRAARQAAQDLADARGVSVELVDLLSLAPLDKETIRASVRKTGRLVVAQEEPRSYGAASEVIAAVTDDEAFWRLVAPPRRVAGYDVVTPYFGREEKYLPDAPRIVRALEEVLAC